MIKFVLMVNKVGQTRLAQYYDFLSVQERTLLEAEIIRKCLSRTEVQCSFMEYRNYHVVYRRYASLYFIVGSDTNDTNELGLLEFIHALVETLDKYFENGEWSSVLPPPRPPPPPTPPIPSPEYSIAIQLFFLPFAML